MTLENNKNRRIPFYQVVDGFRIPGFFSVESFRSAVAYKPRPDDLFIVTYPKCGTTWMQNIVACIFKNGKPFENYLESETQTPFLEMVGTEAARTMERPGSIKIHLPFHLAPWSPEAKYIFIARNPKDCCVSFYHHTENFDGYNFVGGSFDDYFELFIEGRTDFGDYFDTVMSWFEHRNDPNVFFITYEEMKEDIESCVLKIAEFIGSQYKESLEKDKGYFESVIRYSSFSYMKESLRKHLAEVQNMPKEIIKNIPDGFKELIYKKDMLLKKEPSENNFLRKGVVGDWRNYFSLEQNERLDNKFKERMGHTELAEMWKSVMKINSSEHFNTKNKCTLA